MCLTKISDLIKAKTDILAYKCLDFDDYQYVTPFQYMPINFVRGRCGISSEVIVNINNRTIDVGIHSFYSRKCADKVTKTFRSPNNTHTHYPIIPKDAIFYIGMDGDIVSDKLIIFREKRNYNTYKKNNYVDEDFNVKPYIINRFSCIG